jgi:hypothetical protein
VTTFADKFEKEGGDLHILVMNAAITLPVYQRTTDGWETMLVYFIFFAQLWLTFTFQATSQLSGNVIAFVAPHSTTSCCREKVLNTFTDDNCVQWCYLLGYTRERG